ncbi:hypothetical protein [Labedaea rhizosphaerae]|nr:hypothetical protein [Labedaea rhizosphaerae]
MRDGSPCGLLVARDGERCYRHETPEDARHRLASELVVQSRTRAEVLVPDRVVSALDHCARLVTSEQWRDAVAGMVITRVPDKTWTSLLTSGRSDRCLALANTAADVLIAGKSPRGPLFRRMRVAAGMGRTDQRFARQLAKRIKLPAAARATAVGRGLQVTGILLCLADGQDLDRCQCFVDLARTEFKQRVKQILVAAAHDWVNLALYPGRGQHGRTLGEVRPMRYRAEAEQSRTDLPPVSRTDLPPYQPRHELPSTLSRTDLPPVRQPRHELPSTQSRTDLPPVRQPRHELPSTQSRTDLPPVRQRIDLGPRPVHPEIPPMRAADSDIRPVRPRTELGPNAMWRQGPAES